MFRYSTIERLAKKIYRVFFPVPKSPWTIWPVDDICRVNLVPPKDLQRFFSNCLSLLQSLKWNTIGDYLEFGVFNWSSLASMYHAVQESNVCSMRFFWLDAFEGLPPESEWEDDGVWKKWFYTCSFDRMQECLKRKNIDSDSIIWIKWWYKDTLNDSTIKKFNIFNPGIVFIDCDTYSSSKTVLDFIAPLVNTFTIVCLDDWKLNDLDIKWMGEYRAFNEFLEQNKHIYAKEILSYNRKSKSFLLSVKSR